MDAQQGTVADQRQQGRDARWARDDDPEYRSVSPGGVPATFDDGRPVDIAGAECRAVTLDRAGASQCRRMGWFALEEPGGAVIRPLCSTHLKRLAANGGPVLA